MRIRFPAILVPAVLLGACGGGAVEATTTQVPTTEAATTTLAPATTTTSTTAPTTTVSVPGKTPAASVGKVILAIHTAVNEKDDAAHLGVITDDARMLFYGVNGLYPGNGTRWVSFRAVLPSSLDQVMETGEVVVSGYAGAAALRIVYPDSSAAVGFNTWLAEPVAGGFLFAGGAWIAAGESDEADPAVVAELLAAQAAAWAAGDIDGVLAGYWEHAEYIDGFTYETVRPAELADFYAGMRLEFAGEPVISGPFFAVATRVTDQAGGVAAEGVSVYWVREGEIALHVLTTYCSRVLEVRQLTGTITAGNHDILIYNGSTSLQALVESALGRFTAAGLPAPAPRSVAFPPSVSSVCPSGYCVRHAGLAIDTSEGVDLQFCFGEGEACAGDTCSPGTEARSVLLHELAHVWLVQNVDEARRAAFLAVRGLEVWSAAEVDRDHLGIEHAAEILAWALLEEDTWPARLPNNDCRQLSAGFTALTGVLPPRPCPTD